MLPALPGGKRDRNCGENAGLSNRRGYRWDQRFGWNERLGWDECCLGDYGLGRRNGNG